MERYQCWISLLALQIQTFLLCIPLCIVFVERFGKSHDNWMLRIVDYIVKKTKPRSRRNTLLNYVSRGNLVIIYDHNRCQKGRFSECICVKETFQFIKKDLGIESKRVEARTWMTSSLTSYEILLSQYNEMEQLLWIDSTNFGLSNQMTPLFRQTYQHNTSQGKHWTV